MLDTFDSVTPYTAGTDTAVAADTSNHLQGTGCLDITKSGTSGTTASALRKLNVPQDITWLRAGGYGLKFRTSHADFSNVSTIEVRLVYAYNTSGVPTKYDALSVAFASLTGGQWNEVSGDLSGLTATGSPTDADRCLCVGIQIVVTMGASANTISNVLIDALEFTNLPYSVLIFDGERLCLPIFDIWDRNTMPSFQGIDGEGAAEITFETAWQKVRAGIKQVRKIHDVDGYTHTLEESLRLFSDYAIRNPGWGLALPGGELVNTTLNGAVSKGALSIVVDSILDVSLLGDACSLRIGPNASRQVERVKVVSRSSSTLYLDRPLRYAHEDETPVRSVNYYPSLTSKGKDFALREAGSAVTFTIEAVEP